MTQIWPKRCCCLVKNELKYAGPFGLAALLCGTVFINRLNREKALDTMNKTVGDILERNVSYNNILYTLSILGSIYLYVRQCRTDGVKLKIICSDQCCHDCRKYCFSYLYCTIRLKFGSTYLFPVDLMTTVYVLPSLYVWFPEKAIFSHAIKLVFTLALEELISKKRYLWKLNKSSC
jgi:hypothetical protein